MKVQAYTPIDCNYYDRLEAWATRRQEVSIAYRNATDGCEQLIKSKITDLQTKAGVEYMHLATGLVLRLDQLISVEGIPVVLAC